MNTPSLNGGNWRWRFGADQLRPEIAAKLAELVELSDRMPKSVAPQGYDSFAA
jgi:hypothetical protein